MAAAPTLGCRWCAAPAPHSFDGPLLGKYRVAYHECTRCGSLQTEQPTWLHEAYAQGNLASLDTGSAQRNLNNLGAVLTLARWLGLRSGLDFGGGDGLLVRMLRDRGIDAHVVDRHAQPSYAAGFGRSDPGASDFVTAFEVVEHFVNPAQELPALLAAQPAALLLSTDVWQGQGPAWWYLAPETGQHVFFYSRRALDEFAQQAGYSLQRTGGYWLMLRHGRFSPWRARICKLLLSSQWRRLRTAWAVTRATPGVMRDHEALAARPQKQGIPP